MLKKRFHQTLLITAAFVFFASSSLLSARAQATPPRFNKNWLH